ncbi:uncharacterized protein cfap97d2 [Conger conger]|uniref:uncharacterized protein cfap97d2 n=1 Tax=Conger conger TaxID=82655 RepID=UPI002A5A1980|nr:uncharacterized protein cfap97d2 [Conger conger]
MQHRAYQPVLPCGNKYLQLKWDRTDYQMHRSKVKYAKPEIRTDAPRTFGHLQLKLKKLKLEEERMSIIQRDNKTLLDKMSVIMRTTGRIDNKNEYETRSLSRERRQQELRRVTQENREIGERLSRCGPKYSTREWHEDWKRAEGYRDSIARYPRGATQTPKSIKQTKEGKGEKSVKKRSSREKAETDEQKAPDADT